MVHLKVDPSGSRQYRSRAARSGPDGVDSASLEVFVDKDSSLAVTVCVSCGELFNIDHSFDIY